MEERVVLVDAGDREIGTEEKMEAHRRGLLHRAISVFVFRPDGSLLLQRRAWEKYHSGGLWTNTCCTHPRPGESVAAAARRRLREEMGFECELREVFDFTYRAELDGELIEHELDHVFFGVWDGTPAPNPDEVAEWRWDPPSRFPGAFRDEPQAYTAWFPIAWNEVLARGTELPA